ncbi:histidine phosphatase family protein [Lacihabitans sp. LS3-19]|uniref:histidine phosphatase family protein n=1 Tax=Lacihabitans sp. LS3-19 TaxID=2487335 RepID=UPI0020CE2C87|nr:histidine phosphatase family protein [Lacihabitans sp. LS3-19]MCP9768029.1 histidine phosphatase family protein [Lacihabitans sp. LS3-19]
MFSLINFRKNIFIVFLVVWALNSCTTSFYVVRHAEKSSTPKNDPVLTEAGMQRAERLKDILVNKKIKKIYSTQTVRTTSTAQPLSDAIHIPVEIYDAKNQTEFIATLKKSKKNTLVVGHSNTIRYIINGLAEKEVLSKDLEDNEYSNLYIVRRGKVKVERY